MKIKIILIIILLGLIIGSVMKYFDLCVSQKYEIQLEGLNPTKEQVEFAQKLKEEIDSKKTIVISILVGSLFLLCIIFFLNNKVYIK